MPCRPTLHNKTRWTGKHVILEKCTIIRNSSMKALIDDESNVHMNRSQLFYCKVRKFERMLHFVKLTEIFLQTRKLKLSDGRAYLDMLIEDVTENASDPNHPRHQCNLGTTRVGHNSNKSPSLNFAKGVIKYKTTM